MGKNRLFIEEFGFALFSQQLLFRVLRKLIPVQSVKDHLYKREHTFKRRVLGKELGPVIDSLVQRVPLEATSVVNKTIWVFWWQGNQNEIPLVSTCLNSLERQKRADVELVILTKDNLSDYCTIPPILKEKFEAGVITITHFSDIVRMALLAQRGGVWLDATVYAVSDFSYIFEHTLWSMRKPVDTHQYIPMGRWSAYAIGSGQGNPVAVLMLALFEAYWERHQCMIDYFLVDYSLDLLCERVPQVRASIDSIKPNNPQALALQSYLNKPFDQGIYESLCTDTQLFKLSRREKLHEMQGEIRTLYGWLLDKGNRHEETG
ncbi:MAG: capsular polysaccharide synthesis protein [Christensenellales bacterium]|jgi:hypothetical protein